MQKKLAIFGSGSGSNAEKICQYFTASSLVKVSLICTNNQNSFIVKRAKKLDIPLLLIKKTDLKQFNQLHATLKKHKIDFIILAGFLLKIPEIMVNLYHNRIINIHPSLLPKYGGRGMYGENIHKQVLKNKEEKSGITIHFVNREYDKGEIILQKSFVLDALETLSTLSSKIKKLEHQHLPKTIENVINKSL